MLTCDDVDVHASLAISVCHRHSRTSSDDARKGPDTDTRFFACCVMSDRPGFFVRLFGGVFQTQYGIR